MSDSITQTDKRLKLFVGGEVSADPREWKYYHELVLAETEEEAIEMMDAHCYAIEVDMTIPCHLPSG